MPFPTQDEGASANGDTSDPAPATTGATISPTTGSGVEGEACEQYTRACAGWRSADGLSADLTYAVEARDAWRDYAHHAAHCVECGQTSWENCHEGSELRAAAEQADKLIDPGHGAESQRLRDARAEAVEAREHGRRMAQESAEKAGRLYARLRKADDYASRTFGEVLRLTAELRRIRERLADFDGAGLSPAALAWELEQIDAVLADVAPDAAEGRRDG